MQLQYQANRKRKTPKTSKRMFLQVEWHRKFGRGPAGQVIDKAEHKRSESYWARFLHVVVAQVSEQLLLLGLAVLGVFLFMRTFAGAPFTVETEPWSVTVDASGNFVYVVSDIIQ